MDINGVKKFTLNFSPYEMTVKKFEKITISDYEHDKKNDLNKLIERTQGNPKLHIWIGAYSLSGSIVDMQGYSDYLKYEKATKFLSQEDEEAI